MSGVERTPEELLSELLYCFFIDEDGLEWDHEAGKTVGRILGKRIESELIAYKERNN